jgi:hypothetical protein
MRKADGRHSEDDDRAAQINCEKDPAFGSTGRQRARSLAGASAGDTTGFMGFSFLQSQLAPSFYSHKLRQIIRFHH